MQCHTMNNYVKGPCSEQSCGTTDFCGFYFCFLIVRTVNTDGFKPNLETHLIPLLAMEVDKTSPEPDDKIGASPSKDGHHQLLMQVSL